MLTFQLVLMYIRIYTTDRYSDHQDEISLSKVKSLETLKKAK